MKTLPRMVIVFIAVSLMTADFSFAQAVSETVPQQVQTVEPSMVNISQNQKKLEDLTRAISLSTGTKRYIGSGTANTVLIIPTQEIKTEELLTIREDINVMSRIFGNKLGQSRFTSNWMFSRGGDWYSDYFGRGSMPEGMYLQGYGTLFLMKVDFPLSAPPEVGKQEEKKSEKDNVDQVWMDTRRQMYEPQDVARRGREMDDQQEKYDAEKVESLKTNLIEALKHAANIRAMKPDESVILSITGSGISDRIVSMQPIAGTNQTLIVKESGGKQITRVYTGGLPEDIKLSSPTMLIIRAKKTDIDNFAKGNLNLEQFRGKVQILSYPLLSENPAGASASSIVLPTTEEFSR